MFNIFTRTENSHSYKEIWEEMTADIKRTNRTDKMTNERFSRIEKKLFTEQENIDFLLELVKDMVGEKL
ncbi:hypothetical protein LCGC14_2466770 [marine sediment metagenome]|uniref:Uncharacterized protein n=1 Tax=marine sediment metagenome TaxID=412755 RepID=A0A0F9BC95_9ZZZZ